MKNSLIIVIVLVLIAGGFYYTSMKKGGDQMVEEGSSMTTESMQKTSDDQKILNIVSAESKVTYDLNEDLRGVRTHVVGTSSAVEGSVLMNTASKKIEGVEVKVDASTFKTDIATRDENVKKMVLKSDQAANQYISFKATSVEAMASGESFPVKVTGDITILGVTKSVTFEGMGSVSADGSVSVKANTMLAYGDFGVTIPDFPFLANIDKTVKLSVELAAR